MQNIKMELFSQWNLHSFQDPAEIQALLKTDIELEVCLQKEARCISIVLIPATFWVELPLQHVSLMERGAIQLLQDVSIEINEKMFSEW